MSKAAEQRQRRVQSVRQVPEALKDPRIRPGHDGWYASPDVIELLCAGCTPEFQGDRWAHERSCAFRGRPL